MIERCDPYQSICFQGSHHIVPDSGGAFELCEGDCTSDESCGSTGSTYIDFTVVNCESVPMVFCAKFPYLKACYQNRALCIKV